MFRLTRRQIFAPKGFYSYLADRVEHEGGDPRTKITRAGVLTFSSDRLLARARTAPLLLPRDRRSCRRRGARRTVSVTPWKRSAASVSSAN